MDRERRAFLKGASIAVLSISSGCASTSDQTDNSGSSSRRSKSPSTSEKMDTTTSDAATATSQETTTESGTGSAKQFTTQQETSVMGTDNLAGDADYVSLTAQVVEHPTGATVVNASDDRIDDITPIQEVIDEAIAIEQTDTEDPLSASVDLEAENATEVENALDELPQYGDTTTYYIRKDKFVIKLEKAGLKKL